MPYKLYREHKYISAVVNDVVRVVAKTDFTAPAEVVAAKKSFDALLPVLAWHSHYEDETLHPLLARHNLDIFAQVQQDHEDNKHKIARLQQQFAGIMASTDRAEQIELGDQLYLDVRTFSADNLRHLDEEERLLLPVLQRLYSDEQLRAAEFEVYRVMSIEQVIRTFKALFPHMNPNDRETFLSDSKACDAGRFIQLWEGVKTILPVAEHTSLALKLR